MNINERRKEEGSGVGGGSHIHIYYTLSNNSHTLYNYMSAVKLNAVAIVY